MSGRRDRRDRRSAEKQDESNSLEDSSTPVDLRPYKSTDIPKDVIQDNKLHQENVVTAAAASNIQQIQDKPSGSDSNSDTSEIIRRRIFLSTQKKKEQEEQNQLQTPTQPIPFNINMVDFDAELLIVVEKWLGGNSSNNDIRLMLIANQYKTFDDFRCITPKMISVMEREIRPGQISKLKEVYALRLEEILD